MTATVNAFAALASTEDFSAPVGQMTVEQQVEAYIAAMMVEEAAKVRREQIREKLLKAAEAEGRVNEKGGYKLFVGAHTVLREKRVASAPDEKKLVALLEQKQMMMEAAFDKVTTLQPNPSKVSALVESGHFTQEEAAALYRVSHALVVRAGEELESLYESVTPETLVAPKKSR